MHQIPKQIDRYPIIKSLGKGGMGEVYLAFDPVCERKIAIKCIRSDLLKHKNITSRFLNEAKIASQLNHPSIVPIYSIHAGEEKMYYIMPYVEGETLKEIIRDTFILQREGKEPHPIGSSIQSLLRIFLHICHAISYAHSKGFLHRDIKPENVIVGKFGEVLVLDWGLAEKLLDPSEDFEETDHDNPALTRLGKVVGTLSYLAPERAIGNKADIQTDIYALGVILYQVLSLRIPFKRKTMKEFQKRINEEVLIDPAQIAPSRDIPKALSIITQKALDPRPHFRYQSITALIQDIEKYLEGRPDWIHEVSLDINRPDDFVFQETVLLNPYTAITQLGPLSEWVILMLAKKSFPGNIKIAAEVTLLPESNGLGFLFSLPSSSATDALQRGFCVWLGSKKNKGIELFLDNVQVLYYPDLFVDKTVKICIEKIDSNVFFSINDKTVFTYVGHIPTIGSQIGLICKDMQFSIVNWNIYTGSQNAMVNCLSIPDAFFAAKHLDKALYEYRKIADSFKGRTEGREAIFRSGITLLEISKGTHSVKEKEKLIEKAYEEFEKLRTTSGSPLEYLGKSLFYKEEKDIEEESKCLELTLRKYANHPLIHRIHEHVLFRLHELSNKDRTGTYLFALLTIRYLHGISNQNTKQLIDLLKQYLQTLYFFEHVEEPSYEQLHLAIQLAFWLKKPLTLFELSQEKLPQALINNIYFAFIHLNEDAFVEKLLHFYPHPLFEKLLQIKNNPLKQQIDFLLLQNTSLPDIQRAIIFIIEKHYMEDPQGILAIFDRLKNIAFSKELKMHMDNIYIQALILTRQLSSADKQLGLYPLAEIVKPSSPLYPAFALLYKNSDKHSLSIFRLIQEKFPPITSFIGHILSKNLHHDTDWFHQAFYFEKEQFNRYITLIKKA
ncbi:MAG: protein kinase [Chlamydiales bacterium]|nr:protein kinase [Chlamydiales bacterium]